MAHRGRHLNYGRATSVTRALWLIGLLAVGTGAPAQPAAELHLQFTVFSAAQPAALFYTPRPGSAPTRIEFYPTARSPTYNYQGGAPLRFYLMPRNKPTNSGALSPVAEVTPPPGVHDLLLLFISQPSVDAESPHYRIEALNDDRSQGAPGRLTVINLSGLALGGRIGHRAVAFAGGINSPLAIGRAAEIVLHTPFKGRNYQSYAGTVELGEKESALLIFFPPWRAGSLEVQSRLLVDGPPPAPPKWP